MLAAIYNRVSAAPVYEVPKFPTNTKRSANVGTMLAHRLRRWSNTVPTLAERLVFAGWTMPVWHLAYYVVMIPFLSKSDAAREITLSYHDPTVTLSLSLRRFKLLKRQIKLYMPKTLIHLIFVLYNNALTLANMNTYDYLMFWFAPESDQVSV